MKIQALRYMVFAAAIAVCAASAFSQTKQTQIDTWMRHLIEAESFDGGILVASRGKVIYQRSSGFADFKKGTRNTSGTHFPIASVTKTFTSTAILQQVEKGLIDVDKSVASYLPGFPYEQIKVKNLLAHTSGLQSFTPFLGELRAAEPRRIFSNTDLLNALIAKPKPLLFEPGSKWQYDNINYAILALILEKISGESYPAYIERHILKPAGMLETVYIADIYDPKQQKFAGLAMPHWFLRLSDGRPTRGDKIPYVNDYWHAYQLYGFGDLVSTARDLLKYDVALRSNKLITAKSQTLAAKVVTLSDGQPNSGRYGLGWNVSEDSELGKRMFHEGASLGLSSVLYRSLDRDITIIVYDVSHQNALQIAWNVFNILSGKRMPDLKKDGVCTFGRVLMAKGGSAAIKAGSLILRDRQRYSLDKERLLRLGYELLGRRDPFHIGLKPMIPDAVALFEFGIKAFPDDAEVQLGYSEALARSGALTKAIKAYKRVLDLDPNNPAAKKALDNISEQGH
ncbi:MAG TPA: serine hydrolase [Pyrinomonadaceae bacterium]|nr:serine hydrolase [Pyrinomonadaceae bacterium]